MRQASYIVVFCILFIAGSVTAQAQTTADLPGQATATTAAPQTVQPSRDERYRIGFQDVLEVQVYHHPELSLRYPVSPNGTISMFKLDRPVMAVCKTEFELANDIAAAYKVSYLRDPQVRVMAVEQKSQSVMIIGAVEHPGTYYLSRRVHLLEALATAGGPNKESGTRMLVARTGSASNCQAGAAPEVDDTKIALMDFKIRDVQEGKSTLWMQPGDVISLLPADLVYVYGNVNKQGALTIREPITLTQAIASAEGLLPATKKDRIRILRQSPGTAERQELVFDLNQIDKGKIKDPYLEPNDIVAVSEDRASKIWLGLMNTIKSAAPSAFYRF